VVSDERGQLTVRIRTVKPELTDEEAAEFRGLFFGEGHLDLVKAAASQSFCVRLRIAVRDDDRAVVEWCRTLFGGNLSITSRTRSVCWQLTAWDSVAAALDVLAGGTLPSKKRREVELAREALNVVPGCRVTTAEMARRRVRLIEIRDALIAARAYRTEVA
jgi:hypothetical protein